MEVLVLGVFYERFPWFNYNEEEEVFSLFLSDVKQKNQYPTLLRVLCSTSAATCRAFSAPISKAWSISSK